jgi:hypothetical protein
MHDQRSAITSARRMPVTNTSQTNMLQSGLVRAASSMMRAASSVLGGSGLGTGWRGRRAISAGLELIQPHLVAAPRTALRIAWICRMVDACIGWHW